MERYPKYLYHYTTIESLAMILKSKKIKFNPLTAMDDPQEQLVKDASNYGKYVFISSWIDESRESIAMWKLYSDFKCGVRIKLPLNPFKAYVIPSAQIERVIPGVKLGEKVCISIIPINEFIDKDYFLINFFYDKIVERVKYNDEIDALIPNILKQNGKNIKIASAEVGKYKNTYWDFQNEVRYILRFLPVNLKNMHINGEKTGDGVLKRIIFPDEQFKLKNYFLEIADSAWNEMEITLSPMITPGYQECVYALKEKYNKSMIIKPSLLEQLIKQ